LGMMPQPPKIANASQDSEIRPLSANAGLEGRKARPSRRKGAIPEPAAGKPVALTVKVDQPRYEALKVLGARTRRSNQEILLAALDAYLRRAGNIGPSNVRPTGGRIE
jgi:hypothetical protein